MILGNATLATMQGGYGLIPHAALVIEGDRIAWLGPQDALPHGLVPTHDLGGRLVTPGLIDCHTHVVFAGTRAPEFEMRLTGASYEEICQLRLPGILGN